MIQSQGSIAFSTWYFFFRSPVGFGDLCIFWSAVGALGLQISARERVLTNIFLSEMCNPRAFFLCLELSDVQVLHSFQFLDIFLNCFDDHWY